MHPPFFSFWKPPNFTFLLFLPPYADLLLRPPQPLQVAHVPVPGGQGEEEVQRASRQARRPRKPLLQHPIMPRRRQRDALLREVRNKKVFFLQPRCSAFCLRHPHLAPFGGAERGPFSIFATWRRGSWEGYGLQTFWWGGTRIQTWDLLLESQECNHYATGAARNKHIPTFLSGDNNYF